MKKIAVIIILLTFLSFSFSAFCQINNIEGTYELIADDDGSTPKTGATITLNFLGGVLFLKAEMPSEIAEGEGKYTIVNNKISLSFEEFYFSCENAKYSLEDNKLTLPIAFLGGENGSASYWRKIAMADGTPVNQGDDDSGSEADDSNNDDKAGDESADNNEGEDSDDDGEEDDKKSENNKNKKVPSDKFEDYPANHYAGRWYGNASGWEVRFKHTSGDFVSQFTGTDKGDLPFENEKVIMSLTVQHGASFYIDVDEEGNITGKGKIYYDLLPNLCAVAALTEQVNSAINMLEKIGSLFVLSKKIAQAAVEDFTYTFLGLKGDLAIAASIGNNIFGSKPNEYMYQKIEENFKKFYMAHQQRETLCKCVAGVNVQGDGTQVGPATAEEYINEFGLNVAKSMFGNFGSISAPVGMMLAIPGVTQIQYHYKGMIDRPQQREFTIKGEIIDGEMYLEVDEILGDDNLWIEYTVNYQTDKASFPVWSPFMSNPGMVKGGGIYKYQEVKDVEKEIEYVNPTTKKKEKITVTEQKITEKEEIMHKPFAEFNQSGTQRNNVSVWHEYEYNWAVFKFE
jgi:hypothetical protein